MPRVEQGVNEAGLTRLEAVRQAKLAEIDEAMSAIDRRLIRPLASGETALVAAINNVQAQNRELRTLVLAAEAPEEIEAITPAGVDMAALAASI